MKVIKTKQTNDFIRLLFNYKQNHQIVFDNKMFCYLRQDPSKQFENNCNIY